SATLQLHSSGDSQTTRLTMTFLGANEHSSIRAVDQLPGFTNYFYGSRKNWVTDVPNFRKVRVENIYAGVDAVYYGSQSRFEYDLIVEPGASANLIDIVFDSAAKLAVEETGDLLISLGDQEIRQSKPLIYQVRKDGRTLINGHYVLTNRHVGFKVGKYD